MFDSTIFQTHIENVNSRFSRIRESSLEPLLQAMGANRGVLRGVIPQTIAENMQEAVFNIPYDKQQKYKTALDYLAQNSSIKICGRPKDPVLEFVYFAAGEFPYVGINSAGQQILSSTHPNARKVHSYHHVFDVKWKSSTGNMISLTNVGTREHVKFRTAPGLPPFNQSMADTPQEFFHGESHTGANGGIGRDDHSTKPPCLITLFPPAAGEIVADQWYQYTINNGLSWHNIPGAAYNIVKGIRRSSKGAWVFYFIKKNWLPHNKKSFHFEVEYELLPPMPPPAPGVKFNRTSGTQANIKDYAYNVIRMK